MADNQHYVIDDGQNKIPGYTKTEVDELIESGAKAWSGTQAEYNALKQAGLLQPRSLYIITDAANLNGTAADLSFDGTATTTKQAIDNKIGMDMTPLYTNSKYVPAGGHIDLSAKPSLFRWLLIRFQTNAEFCTQLINTNDTTMSFSQTIMANGTSGQVTYPLAYNATLQGKIDDTNSRINILSDFYNNPNYQLRITNVWGVSRK